MTSSEETERIKALTELLKTLESGSLGSNPMTSISDLRLLVVNTLTDLLTPPVV